MQDLEKLVSALGVALGPVEALDPEQGDPAGAKFKVPGEKAFGTWKALRAAHPETGHWPVILGDDRDLAKLIDHYDGAEPTLADTWRERALSVDPQAWLDSRLQKKPARLGSWPEKMPPDRGIDTAQSLGKPLPECWMGLIPATSGLDVIAHFKFGDWGICPDPSVHIALLRHWEKSHGAEVVALTSKVIETTSARPATTREEAVELAKIHYAYCPDLCDWAGVTVEALAAALWHRDHWFFWWD